MSDEEGFSDDEQAAQASLLEFDESSKKVSEEKLVFYDEVIEHVFAKPTNKTRMQRHYLLRRATF
jgi:hypothetical protein